MTSNKIGIYRYERAVWNPWRERVRSRLAWRPTRCLTRKRTLELWALWASPTDLEHAHAFDRCLNSTRCRCPSRTGAAGPGLGDNANLDQFRPHQIFINITRVGTVRINFSLYSEKLIIGILCSF